MEKVYDKDGKLCHFVVRLTDANNERVDLVEDTEFIQCALLKLPSGKTFRPHKHILKDSNIAKRIAQESWVVISGSVKVIFYDEDDNHLCDKVLNAGDASFTLYGGHNYLIIEDNSIIYEYKTGPYEGQTNDKVFLNI